MMSDYTSRLQGEHSSAQYNPHPSKKQGRRSRCVRLRRESIVLRGITPKSREPRRRAIYPRRHLVKGGEGQLPAEGAEHPDEH
jgi:hypothetical protein